jgi:AraC-like DNA-binding protein
MRQLIISMLSDSKVFTDYFSNYFYQIQKIRTHLYFPDNNDGDIKSLFRSLAIEAHLKNEGYKTVCQSYLSIIFTKLSTRYLAQIDGDEQNPEMSRQLADIIAYLHENYRDITLNKLAERFHYSSTYLSSLLKKHTGKGFKEIVVDIKLERAREYLEKTELSTDKIARLVGLGDASYLSHVYRDKYGEPPSRYRSRKKSG